MSISKKVTACVQCFSFLTGWCSTPNLLLICFSFNRQNGHPLLICSSRYAAAQLMSGGNGTGYGNNVASSKVKILIKRWVFRCSTTNQPRTRESFAVFLFFHSEHKFGLPLHTKKTCLGFANGHDAWNKFQTYSCKWWFNDDSLGIQ